MCEAKPRRVKAKITRTVVEVAVIILDRDGQVEELEEVHEELDCDITDVEDIISVLSVHE